MAASEGEPGFARALVKACPTKPFVENFVGRLCRKWWEFDKVSDKVSGEGLKIDALGTGSSQGLHRNPSVLYSASIICEMTSKLFP